MRKIREKGKRKCIKILVSTYIYIYIYIGTFNKTTKINKNIYVEVILISILHYNIY